MFTKLNAILVRKQWTRILIDFWCCFWETSNFYWSLLMPKNVRKTLAIELHNRHILELHNDPFSLTITWLIYRRIVNERFIHKFTTIAELASTELRVLVTSKLQFLWLFDKIIKVWFFLTASHGLLSCLRVIWFSSSAFGSSQSFIHKKPPRKSEKKSPKTSQHCKAEFVKYLPKVFRDKSHSLWLFFGQQTN